MSGLDYHRRHLDRVLDELSSELPAVLLVGPRAAGKTTTAVRRARSVIRLDVPGEAAAFRADPDAILAAQPEPVLIDEWQAVPQALPAVKRAVDAQPRPGRFLLTGSVSGDLEGATAAGTGRIVHLRLLGMTQKELRGHANDEPLIDRLAGAASPLDREGELNVREYVELALQSGFPEAATLTAGTARQRWLEGYAAQVTTRDASAGGGTRDPERMRRYLEAYALNSAGLVEARTLYLAAGIDRKTAAAYDRILENVFVVELMPAWSSNRLKRLVRAPKRYMIDPGLMAAVLRVDALAILRDGDLLGRLLETFVVAQLRGELEVCQSRPRLYHLRDQDGRREVDLILELAGGRVIACEIKASASVEASDARHLAWLRDQLGERFAFGVVFHTGPRAFSLSQRIDALPISTIWS